MNADAAIVISDSDSDAEQPGELHWSQRFDVPSPFQFHIHEESDEEFQRDLRLAKELSLQSYYADVDDDGYEVDDESSACSDCSITMTTGTQIRLKQSSVKDESDIDMPRIRFPLSKQLSQSRPKYRQNSKHKKTCDGRHHHRGDRKKESAGDKGAKKDKNNTDESQRDEKFPKALKPLRPILSDESLPDLSDHTHSTGCDKENGKGRHVKSKQSVHEEWKKYVPPLFSVAADIDDTKAESYGERQRNLYNKFNDTIARTTKKHHSLYKTHEVLKKSKKKSEKTTRNSPVKVYKSLKHSRQNLKPSYGLKLPNKSKLLKVKLVDKVGVFDDKFRKERKQLGDKKTNVFDSSFTDPHRNSVNRMRRFSEQSESSVCTIDSCSSWPSNVSSASQNKSDIDSITDSEVSFADSDQSGDELDKINANIVRRREENKVRKRRKSFDQSKASRCLKPIQRSFSCIEKPNIQSHDKSIFEILEEDICESDYSVKSEKEDGDSKVSEFSFRHYSPYIGKEKLKLHFQFFRKSLEKLSPSDLNTNPSFVTPKKEFLHCDYQSDFSSGNAIKKDSKISDSPPSENEKVKLQFQEFRQKVKCAFQKASNESEVSQMKQSYDLPKINRHFLDVLACSEKSQESKMDCIKSETQGYEESPLPKIELKHIRHKTGETPDIVQTEVKIEKNQEHMMGDYKSETVEESPLPKIERYTITSEPDLIQTRVVSEKCQNSKIGDDIEQSNLHKTEGRFNTNKTGNELNVDQTELVSDWPLHRIDLSKTNLYASSAPIHKVDLTKTELYLGPLPLLKIDIKATNIGLCQSHYTEEMDSEPQPLDSQDTQNQPRITDYFIKKDLDESIEDKKSVVYDSFHNMEKPVLKCESKSSIQIKDCSVFLERLKITHLLPKLAESDEEEDIDNKVSDCSSNKPFQRRNGRKRKVKCQRLLHKKSNPSSCIVSSSQSQHTLADSKLFVYDRQMKQLECFMQEARIDCNFESAQIILPQSHTNMIQACAEEGCVNLQHNLEFLNWFCSHYKPHAHIMSPVIETAFFGEVNIELVHETFHLLQKVNAKFPGQIKVEWKIIEKCLDISIVKRLSGEASELSILQASLLLKLLIQVLKLDLYSKDLSAQAEIRKSLAYKLLSHDVHSPYPNDLVNYLGLLTTDTKLEGSVQFNSGGDDNMNMTVYVLIQELLSLAIEVSSSCVIMASLLAEELKKLYTGLSKTESRSVLVNSISSDFVRYKLTELILESDYSGTRSLPARFPDSVIQIMECFSKAVPLKLGLPVASDLQDSGDDDSFIESFSTEDCEEIAMLVYYIVISYLECCRKKKNQSLRSRVDYYSSEELATLEAEDEWKQVPEYVDDFLDHLLSLNSNLSPATEHFILLLQCFTDLVE